MDIKYIILHHTAVSYDKNPNQFVATDNYHKSKGFPKSSLGYYVGYHYEISKNGILYTAKKENEQGAHTVGYNHCSIGIALDGNFDIEMPTKEQVEVLSGTLLRLKDRYPKAEIVYHRQFASKTCPGKLIPDNWANNLLNKKQMSNVKIVKNGSETGFYVPARDEASFIDKAMNFGKNVPLTPEGGVDWTKVDFEGTVTLNQ